MGAVDMGAVEAATILAEAMEAVTIKPITAMGPARPAMAIRETRGAVIQVTTGTMAETIGALRPISHWMTRLLMTEDGEAMTTRPCGMIVTVTMMPPA